MTLTTMMMGRFLLLVVFSATSLPPSSCHDESTGFTFELLDRQIMCFHEDFGGDRRYILEYTVLKGGNNDVDVRVRSPSGKILYNAHRRPRGRFEFDISWGAYVFCFSNEFSSFTHKMVYFELRPMDRVEPLAVESGNELAPTANTQMEESMETIHTFSTKVVEFQRAYRLSESIARYRAEELNQRVQWWSMAQSVVIFFIGMAEIFILKWFFTENKELPSSISGLGTSEDAQANSPMRPCTSV